MARSVNKTQSKDLAGKTIYFYIKTVKTKEGDRESIRGPYMKKTGLRTGERLEEYTLIKFN